MSLLQIGKRRKSVPSLRQKIYLSFSSEGFGHSSRALAIAGQLAKEEVVIGTYSYALERVRPFGYTCEEVSQELKFIGSHGSFDVGKTMLQNPMRALGFNQIVQEEADIIKKHGVSLVVADGRMAPVLAASRLNIPCLVLTNQSAFYPFFKRESELVKLFGRSFEWVMKLWLSSAEEILIPDFPPPDTVCLPNLSDNYQVKKRTRFVGPLVMWTAADIQAAEKKPNRPLIVASLGGHEYRRPLFDAVIEAARHMPHVDFQLLAPFAAAGLPANVTQQKAIKDCAPLFKAADAVITQAGHSTAMELLTLGTPAIIVPDTNQIEQENNASRMRALGVAETLRYDHLEDKTQGPLRQAIDKMLASASYRNKAKDFAARAAEIHGAANTAAILREYAHRLIAY